MRLSHFIPFVALALSAPLHAAQSALPEWLAGTWAMQDGSAWAEELWTSPQDGMMLGLGREGFGPKVESWKVIRIQVKPNGIVAYIAQVRGGAPVEFPLAMMSDSAIEFANPSHNYPQRIRYWREGQLLMAEISRIDGSDVQRWNYRPIAP